jgi:hypothetical protein
LLASANGVLKEDTMQDDSDLTDADRTHEGYQQRYKKERRASYMVVLFGLFVVAAVVVVMFTHRYTNIGAGNLANVEPAAGQVDRSLQQSPNMAQPKGDYPPQ